MANQTFSRENSRTRRTIARTFLAYIIYMCAFTPIAAYAASSGSTIDVSDFNDDYLTSASGTNWSYAFNEATNYLRIVTVIGDVTITGKIEDTLLKNKFLVIVVQPGVTANITLDNLNIDNYSPRGKDVCTFDMAGATVNLSLKGDNYFVSSENKAGIHVPPGAALTIDGPGLLGAVGGKYGAGIGGNNGEGCGSITINGGTVVVRGGNAKASAADIGGGNGGSGGTITINGGTVDTKIIGKGVGGTSLGTLTITGGNVDANGASTVEIVPLYAVPKGTDGKELAMVTLELAPHIAKAAVTALDVTVEKSGGGTEILSSYGLNDVYTFDNTSGSLQFFLPINLGDEATIRLTAGGEEYAGMDVCATNMVYKRVITTLYVESEVIKATGITGIPDNIAPNTEITLNGLVSPTDATWKNITWSIKSAGTTGASLNGNKLTATAGGTVVVTATIRHNNGLFGELTKDFTITVKDIPLVVSGGTETTDYSYSASPNRLTIKTGTPMTITGSTSGTDVYRIVVQSGVTANLTLNSVTVDMSALSSSACAFDMAGATVNLTLQGDNTLHSRGDGAGLRAPAGSTLEITEQSSGSLTAVCGAPSGYHYGAGIGGNIYEEGGNITINGGTVNATGKGTGIGAGNEGGSGGVIVINGGTVTATSTKENGAGIGGSGGSAANSGSITINGGIVVASGGAYSAGIGGKGYQSTGTSVITINGGTVSATGGESGAGIGGRMYSGGGTINITGGTITATGGTNAAGIGGGNNPQDAKGTLTITGGSVKRSGTTSYEANATGNGATRVYLTTLTVGDPAVANSGITAGSIKGVSCDETPDAAAGVYGIKDVTTDGDGKLYFYLPVATNVPVSMTADDTDYVGIVSPNTLNTLGSAAVTLTLPDTTAPELTDGSVNRVNDTQAIIGFTTDEAGTAYYLVLESDAEFPANTDVKAGMSFGPVAAGPVSGKAVTLTADAMDIYVVVADAADNISDPLRISAAAFVSPFDGGTGIASDPYLLSNAAELDAVRYYLDKHFKLANDIDLTAYLSSDGAGYNGGAGWKPIGVEGEKPTWNMNAFKGSFDGNGHTISGLYINNTSTDTHFFSLFGKVAGATIKNLGVTEVDITSVSQQTGAIAGRLEESTKIENCYSTGTISRPATGDAYVGGIVGNATDKSRVENCYSLCNISTNGVGAGGISGRMEGNSLIAYCYATGSVSGNGSVGGILGLNNNSTVQNSVAANSSITATATSINRIAGANGTAYNNNYANSGMTVSSGTKSDDDTVNGTGKPLDELKTAEFYTMESNWYNSTAWDFENVWTIDDGNALPVFKWQATTTYTVSIVVLGNGKVEPDKTPANYTEGETVTLTVTPDEGYEIDVVSAYKTGDEETTIETRCIASVPYGTATYEFTMPAFGVTVAATFEHMTGTNIDNIANAKSIVSESYYDLTGKPASATAKGFVIKRTVYNDGSVINSKVSVK